MDYVTRQFINLTKKFRKDLRFQVQKLDRALDKQTQAIRESTQAAAKREPNPSVVNLPESIEVRHGEADTRSEQKYRRRTLLVSALTLLVSTLTLVAVGIYSYLVLLQYREMIVATGAAQQAVTEAQLNRSQADRAFAATVAQFRLDQRAWLGVDGPNGTPKLDEYFAVDVPIRNTGKTPAKKVSVFTTYRPAKKGERVIFDEAKTSSEASNAMVPPNSIYHVNPPIPSDKVKQGDLDLIKRGEVVIFVYGRGTFEDVFSCTHWIQFCYFLTPDTKSWTVCSKHNDTGEEPTKD